MAPLGVESHPLAPGRGRAPGLSITRGSQYPGSSGLGRRQEGGGGAPAPEGPGSAKPSQTKGPAGSFDVVFGIICLVAVGLVALLVFVLYVQRRKRQKRQREAEHVPAIEVYQQPGKTGLADKVVVDHVELPQMDSRRQGMLG